MQPKVLANPGTTVRAVPRIVHTEPPPDIEFIDRTEAPVGLGEPGTTVVAPAIGNAISAATGVRLRHLPIRPAAVLQALASQRNAH